MKCTLLLILIHLFHYSAHSQPPTNPALSDALTFIDEWLEAQQAYERIPGMSVGIVKDQELIWSKGYGFLDMKKNLRTTSGTIYSICSISKLFTSIAIMQLYEDGKLRLDDSVSTILPGFNIHQQFPESGPITIRSLLTHSSGLPRESDYPYWTGPDYIFPTQEQVYDKLGKQETLYPASTYFQYSNLGMTLLGEVVEKISGKPYDEYITENILKPLRLTNTLTYLPQQKWGKEMATGYSALKRDGSRELVPLFDSKGIKAAAGYSSTVGDLANFAAWQFRLLNKGGNEILKASTLKEMQRVQWVDADWKINWGLGFVVNQQHGKTLVGHSGFCPGYRTTLMMDTGEKFAYIVLINTMDNPWKYATQIRNIILKGQTEKSVKPSDVNLQDYHGIYNAQPWGSEKKVISWYGHLAILNLPSEIPLEDMVLLQHVKGDVFRRIRKEETLGEEFIFERDKTSGRVIRMWDHSNFSLKIK